MARGEIIQKMDFLGTIMIVLSALEFIILVMTIYEIMPKSMVLLIVSLIIGGVILCLAHKIYCLLQELSAK